MMWDDKQLAQMLREELDGPAPATKTELSDIVPRGLRRRRMRQVGTVAAAVAVVAGIGVAAMTLSGTNKTLNEPATSATLPAPSVTEAAWDRVDRPAQKPYRTWEPGFTAPPPSGHPKLEIPMCDISQAEPSPGSASFTAAQSTAVFETLKEVVAPATVPSIVDLKNATGYQMDVTDSGGTGSVRIDGGDFQDGSPLAAADRRVFSEGNCAPPKRKVLSDGTVLQIYSIRPSEPFQSLTLTAGIYLPSGTEYQVVVQNWGSPDVKKVKGSNERVGAGRPTLPLTELQLATYVERLISAGALR